MFLNSLLRMGQVNPSAPSSLLNKFLKDAVLEVPVEAVVDVPGEEGGVPELSVALGTGEPLRSLFPSSLLLSPCTYSNNQLIYYKTGSKQKSQKFALLKN